METPAFDPKVQPPRIYEIPDQLVATGKPYTLDLGDFVEISPEEEGKLTFSLEGGPEDIRIDPKTGLVTGTAIATELNKTYLLSFEVLNDETQLSAVVGFRLEIVGSLLLETEEGKAFFAKEEYNFWDASQNWELQIFIQQLIIEHFAWVIMYDEDKGQEALGPLLDKFESSSGWLVLEFENAVMITPANKAYEQYGNRRRILDTLREALIQKVEAKSWQSIAIDGSDIESIGKCWVIAKEFDLPVDSLAPSDVAEINYYNIKRVFEEETPSLKYRLKPQG